MTRIIGLMAAVLMAAAGLVALSGVPAVGQEKKAEPGLRESHHEAVDHCVRACNDCQRACDMCAAHCVRLIADGKKEHVKTLQTCQDCAEICSSAARIVAHHGLFSDLICRSCADACSRCGKQCEQFSDDKLMKACAEECRRCEKECRAMLKQQVNKVEER
jgi:hypothetical protein